ncbi:hypothetical protein RUM44_004239 [Polyplax serrata]|uniref:Uncharacterized protein n=1 Tax=Polyplax serrata TaxID=468196 RepID=A0ABR1B296_POLSC
MTVSAQDNFNSEESFSNRKRESLGRWVNTRSPVPLFFRWDPVLQPHRAGYTEFDGGRSNDPLAVPIERKTA